MVRYAHGLFVGDTIWQHLWEVVVSLTAMVLVGIICMSYIYRMHVPTSLSLSLSLSLSVCVLFCRRAHVLVDIFVKNRIFVCALVIRVHLCR